MPSQSHDVTIADLFSRHQFEVPVFQRVYCWSAERIASFFADAADLIEDPKEYPSDYGAILIYKLPAAAPNKSFVVDGQQRLTSMVLLLASAAKLLEDAGRPADAARIRNQRLQWIEIAADGTAVLHPRIAPQHDGDLDCLRSLVRTGRWTPGEDASSSSLCMNKAFKQFTKLMKARGFFGDPDKILALEAALMERTCVCVREAVCVEQAVDMYQNLNCKGAPLDSMDVCKSALMPLDSAQAPAVEWDAMIQALSDAGERAPRFLAAFIFANLRGYVAKVADKHVCNWLLTHRAEFASIGTPAEIVARMRRAAEQVRWFHEGKDRSGRENLDLLVLASIRGKVARHVPLLLAGGHLSDAQFDRLAALALAIVRAQILASRTEKLMPQRMEDDIHDIAAKIRDADVPARFEAALAHGRSYVRSLVPSARKAIETFRVPMDTSSPDHALGRHILASAAAGLQAKSRPGSKSAGALEMTLDAAGWHDEHILPKNPPPDVRTAFGMAQDVEDALQRLGNHTLLEAGLNLSATNNSFASKRLIYAQSALAANLLLGGVGDAEGSSPLDRAARGLSRPARWTPTDVESRSLDYARLAAEAWEADASEPEESVSEVPQGAPSSEGAPASAGAALSEAA